ncbi:MAG: TIGR00730 family Rossman fold protein [Chitinophagaceae bacterium]|nr:TIGR00730 family Rossman fold protein [Chitinophagaceae bacterium]
MKLSNDQHFLQSPRTLIDEIRDAHKVQADLWQGVSAFAEIKNCVTVYGSARFREGHRYYELARAMGKELAKNNFSVMTGGGPGVMEAANRGAKEGGGVSLGCNIILPFEQAPNLYVDKMVSFEFFFTRKTILRKNSVAYVLMPGGFGTMDEIFEVLTLIQTHKLPPRPVVCLGKDYWKHLGTFIRETMIKEQTISESDLDLAFITDDLVEAVNHIKKMLAQENALQEEIAED